MLGSLGMLCMQFISIVLVSYHNMLYFVLKVIRIVTTVWMFIFYTAFVGSSVNVALGKQAFQQSTYSPTFPAKNAVDGNNFQCTHTNLEAEPWWAVDLVERTCVFSIKITNINDFG